MTIDEVTEYYYSFIKRLIIFASILILLGIIATIIIVNIDDNPSALFRYNMGFEILFSLVSLILMVYGLIKMVKLFGWNEYVIEYDDSEFKKIMKLEGYSYNDVVYSKIINPVMSINIKRKYEDGRYKLYLSVSNYGGLFHTKIINGYHHPSIFNKPYLEIKKVLDHIPEESYW